MVTLLSRAHARELRALIMAPLSHSVGGHPGCPRGSVLVKDGYQCTVDVIPAEQTEGDIDKYKKEIKKPYCCLLRYLTYIYSIYALVQKIMVRFHIVAESRLLTLLGLFHTLRKSTSDRKILHQYEY